MKILLICLCTSKLISQGLKYNLPNQGVIYNFGENQSIGDLSSQYNNFKTLKTKPKLAYSALPLNLDK